jgi:hypothetical protein
MEGVWTWIIANYAHLIPHIVKLVCAYFVFVVHTAEVERGFNIHRLIKTRLRSRLGVVTVDSLMRVKMLVKPFSFDVKDAHDGLIIAAVDVANRQPLHLGDKPPVLLARLALDVYGIQVPFVGTSLAEGVEGEEGGEEEEEEERAFMPQLEDEEDADPDPIESDDDDLPLARFVELARLPGSSSNYILFGVVWCGVFQGVRKPRQRPP